MIVDSHCHVGHNKYEPVEALLHHMDASNVERAVLVQSLGESVNDYQAACVARFPDRLASVVHVDPRMPDAVDRLKKEISRGAVGLRVGLMMDVPEDVSLAIWQLADDCDVTISAVGGPSDVATPAFRELLAQFPNVAVAIEHLGGLEPGSESYSSTEDDRILDLAELPNVFLKFHGLGEFARRLPGSHPDLPFQLPIPDLLHRAIERFGTARLMWGSDWPVVSIREGYANSLAWVRDYLAARTDQDSLAALLGGTAAALHWPAERAQTRSVASS